MQLINNLQNSAYAPRPIGIVLSCLSIRSGSAKDYRNKFFSFHMPLLFFISGFELTQTCEGAPFV